MPQKPTKDAGYLEAAARIIFMGGLNRQVVDKKWPGFREAFHDFAIKDVAAMTPDDVDRLARDDRVIKYRAKLKAVVDNADQMEQLAAEHGSFGDYVSDLLASDGLDATARALAKRFSYISEEGARNWLYSTGYDIGPVSEKIKLKYAPFDPSLSE